MMELVSIDVLLVELEEVDGLISSLKMGKKSLDGVVIDFKNKVLLKRDPFF